MIPFARTDDSIVGRWWWTVDRWLLASLLILMLAGLIFSMAASPPVALNLNQDSFFFVRRHMMFLPVALVVLIGFSLMSAQTVRRAAVILFLGFFTLTALTLVLAPEIKGSTRWLNIAGFTLQPSEFLKPLLFVVCAWMFAERARDPAFPGQFIAGALAAAVVGVLVLQPDFGQAFLVFLVWSAQYFMAGMPLTVLALL
ncbi:MAG: FtsW/RodA/SpoVE family cell cycle protein, partial [Alphaproteobacteria bacterium]|nr:FtsW/RodA/SpoVE family cell cycle protein [Alphaproteobacteria bacterium]